MLGKIILLNKDNLNELDMILKYFYLIDSDQIVKELKSLFYKKRMNIQDTLIDNIFHTTFEKIYEYASLYNQYINPENFTYSAFFNEPGLISGIPGSNPELEKKYRLHNENLKCFQTFLKLFLRNHCITQGFFYNLLQNNSSYVPLTSAFDLFNKLGYFDKPSYKKEDYNKEGRNSQNYYSKFKSFKKLGENNLLKRLLNDCCCEISYLPAYKSGKKILGTDIKLPLIYKHWIYYIFCESNFVKNVSRNLIKINQNKKANNLSYKNYNLLLTNYIELFYEFDKYRNIFPQNCDKFIFNTLGEYYFGFSTIYYINALLKEIHNPYSEYEYLKRYDGKILENILKQLSNSPMPYTRHLFLFYAFEALRYNKDVKCNYLQHSVGTINYSPTKITYSDQTLSGNGLILMTEFFNTINNITLPVLSSLWVVVLNKFIGDSNCLMKYYKSYIDSYYKLLTADFSPLLKDEMNRMKKCCSEKGIAKSIDDISMHFSLKKLIEQLEVLQDSSMIEDNFLSSFDENLCDIIYDFLEPDRNSQLQALSNLCQKISTGDDYELQREKFRQNRARDIFEHFYECN